MRHQRSPLIASAALGLAAVCTPVQAQTVSASFTANTDLTVAAGPAVQTIAAGSDLSAPISQLRAVSPNGLGGAVLQTTFSHSQTGTFLSLGDNANMQVPGETASIGTHETILVLTSTQSVAASVNLVYSAFSTLWPQQASAQGMIDVGNDGTFELVGGLGSPTSEVNLNVVIPPQGLAIRTVTGGASVHPPGPENRVQYHANLRISVRPVSDCVLSGGFGGCNVALGPFVDARMTFAHSLSIATRTLSPNAPVFTGVGATAVNLPIPGTPCELNVLPFAVVPDVSDAAGMATFELPIPIGQPIGVIFQQFIISPPGISIPLFTSGPIHLDCP